jgi:hypothetical protein
MNRLKRSIVLAGVVLGLLFAGCATPPEPFDYQKSNELKPGPGIFTGDEGSYTIYGPPPKPAKEASEASEEEGPAEPDEPAAP